MAAYADADPVFDIRHSPSCMGIITETFRQWPGVVRSLHPTHPVCALGKFAHSLTADHERCTSPCGANSPFDRLHTLDGWILRLGTSVLTQGHWLQDRADFPAMYLPKPRQMRVIDATGRILSVETRVFRPRLPDIFILGVDNDGQARTVRRRDYPFLFPGDREELLRADPKRREALIELLNIRKNLAAAGVYRYGRINDCPADFFSVRAYADEGARRLEESLMQYPDLYRPDHLETRLAAGGYP
jgi:hypothetical protein